MRELVADLFVTLDGFAAADGAPAFFGYPGPDLDRWIQRELDRPQEVVMGRVTYRLLAPVDDVPADPASARLTALPKVVFSQTLRDPLPWANSRRIPVASAATVRALKHEPGPLLRCMGSVSLVKILLAIGELDRLRLVVFPELRPRTGRAPIFTDLAETRLELATSEVLDHRLVYLDYAVADGRPASSAGPGPGET